MIWPGPWSSPKPPGGATYPLSIQVVPSYAGEGQGTALLPSVTSHANRASHSYHPALRLFYPGFLVLAQFVHLSTPGGTLFAKGD
jgi:hypothetical protein